MSQRQTLDGVPLHITNTSEQSSYQIVMKLGKAKIPFLIRLTGGSSLKDRNIKKLGIPMIVGALKGYRGIFIYGGTRVYKITKRGVEQVPTIMDVSTQLRRLNPQMASFGIIPRTQTVKLSLKYGLILDVPNETNTFTVINPDQDVCLLIQKNVDTPTVWDTEWLECLKLTREYKENLPGFGSVLIAFGGGNCTGREILAWAEAGLPVILIADSGRITEEFSLNKLWLNLHPSVIVCKNEMEIRRIIKNLGGI